MKANFNLKGLLASVLMMFSVSVFAQQHTVTGVVVDADNGEPLVGVAVMVSTGGGTTTDANGSYAISAADGATLTFNTLGYMDVNETVNGRSVINVKMTVDSKMLEEVVVLGVEDVLERQERIVCPQLHLVPPEPVEELKQLLFCCRILCVLENHAVDPRPEFQQIEYLVRAFLYIMLEVPRNVYAADPVGVPVEHRRNVLYGLAFAHRQSRVYVDMMTLLDVIEYVLQRVELRERFSACKHDVVMREYPVHEVKRPVASLEIEARCVSVLLLVDTERACVITVVRHEHRDRRTDLRKVFFHM